MKVRLKDLGTIFTGNTPSKRVDEYWDNSDIKFIKPDIIKDELCVISSANEYISAGAKNASRIVPANSVLVTCIGNIGRVGITEEEVAFNQQINAIVPNRTIIPKYLAYAIYANRKQLQAIANAPVVPIINKTQFSDFEISICESLEKQNKIVRILDTISEIITHNKKKIEALDDLIKARFVEMFGSTNNEQVKIAELVEQKISTAKKDFEGDAEIKYIDISSINNRRNTMTGFTKYKMSNAPSRARQHVQFGDIIISTVRPNLKNVAMVSMDSDNLVASSGFCVLRPKKCTSEFLMAIVCSDRFTDAMVNVVTGANYPAIKNSDVLNYCVPLPSEEQQRQFANFVTQVDKSKFTLSNELAMGNFYIRLIHDCIMHGCINL